MTAKRRKELLGKAGIYVSLSAITLLLIFPFVWMISTSLKDKNEMFSATPTLFPSRSHWRITDPCGLTTASGRI